MKEAQCCITWNSYSNHISKGLSSLQQNEEFVDMTLAAEGHLVKVHKNIVAVASPYLKAMIQSTPCRHPVIFLDNIGYEVLGHILEYIYCGEVKVPTSKIHVFIAACKSLCIRGVDSIVAPKITLKPLEPISCSMKRDVLPPNDNFAAHITINPTQADDNDNNEQILPNVPNIPATFNNIMKKVNVAESHEVVNHDSVHEHNVDINNIKNIVILKPQHNDSDNLGFIINEKQKQVKIFGKVIPDWEKKVYSSQIIPSAAKIENSVNILLNNEIQQQQFEQDTSSIDFSNIKVNPLEHPIYVQLDTNDWPGTLNQNSLNKDQNNPNINPGDQPVNITLNTNDWHTTLENNSNIELNGNSAEHPLNVTIRNNDGLVTPGEGNSNIEINNPSAVHPIENSLSGEDQDSDSSDIFNHNSLDKKHVVRNIKKIGSHMKSNTKLPKINNANRIKMDRVPHYTISNRGSLQLLLNRFAYHSHHSSNNGRKIRWRCIDYRKLHCPAYIDTDNETISAMSENHVHKNHDNQIKRKMRANIIFTSYTQAVRNITETLDDKAITSQASSSLHKKKNPS